jgi:hypothetical protein
MLSDKTIKAFAVLAKIKEEDLKKALSDENETDVAIPDGLSVFTKEELEERDNNSRSDGISTGKEIGIKEVKKAAGLPDDAPSKDPAKVAQAIMDKANAESKTKPDEKVKELTTQLDLLKKSMEEKEGEIGKLKNEITGAGLDRQILTSLPKNRASTLTDAEYLTLIKSAISIEQSDGGITVKKDGQVLRNDTTKAPISLNDAINNLFTERKWVEASAGGAAAGGRGAGDASGGAAGIFTKRSEVIAHYEKMGKSVNGADGQEIINKLAELKKADESFDMNN